MGPSRRRHITRTKRALMRSMRSQNYTVRDISQWLACGESTVSKVLRNDYGDSLEEDVDHLDGRAGDITNVDNMSEDSIARTLAALKDEDEALEYVEDATSTRDDESDNHPSISTAAQGARKSARLRGQKAPYIRTSISPDICLRAQRALPRMVAQTELRFSSELTALPDEESVGVHRSMGFASPPLQPALPVNAVGHSSGPSASTNTLQEVVPCTHLPPISQRQSQTLSFNTRNQPHVLDATTTNIHPRLPGSLLDNRLPIHQTRTRSPAPAQPLNSTVTSSRFAQQTGFSRSIPNVASWHVSPFVKRFLETMKPPLTHHTKIFATVGITTQAHIQTLALMKREALCELQQELLGKGLTFMEFLLVLHALKMVHDELVSQMSSSTQSSSIPQTVAAFLGGLHPSLLQHVHVFHSLGICDKHLESLLILDPELYGMFITELRKRGLTFMECLMIKHACNSRKFTV